MIRKLAFAAAPLCLAAPALAADQPGSREVRIPRMSQYLEWVADGQHGLFVRGDTGRWYYARLQHRCSRLRPSAAMGFQTTRGELDRFSSLVVEGWRCPIASVVESAAPAGHEDH